MTEAEIKDSLLTTRLSQFLAPTELDMLLKHSDLVEFSPGEIILEQGKISDGLYVIVEGEVLVTAKVLGSGVTTLTKLGHGNFLGEIGLIEREPSTTNVIAVTTTRCVHIAIDYFDTLAVLFPEMKYQITQAILNEISDRLKVMHKKIIDIMAQTDMAKSSLFGVVIKSLTKPSVINFSETDLTLEYLKEIELFNMLRFEDLKEFLKHSKIISAPKKCNLIHSGEFNKNYYIVLRGAVQSSIVHEKKVAKLSVLGPASFFCGITTLDENYPAIIDYTTCERAVLLEISKEELDFLHQNYEDAWYKIFDLMCQSFVSLERSARKLEIRLNSEIYNYV